MPIRVACYIDGFNVYHAIDEISRAKKRTLDHLKWLDLRRLMDTFIDPQAHEIVSVVYFSAYMNWNQGREAKHREYVKALEASGVKAVMGRFKEKDAYCKNCHTTYKAREEKESDVNIATHFVSDAYENNFDQAFIVSNDSDLLGPIRFVRARFPAKKVKIIAPPLRRHSKELWAIATHRASIKESHLASCLFPEELLDRQGKRICLRPPDYAPPP